MTLEPPGLDPTTAAAAAIAEVTLYNVYETLTKIKEDGSVAPLARRKLAGLARPEDLHLQAAQGRQVPERRTVQFAQPVKFSFERAAAPTSTNKDKSLFQSIAVGHHAGRRHRRDHA